MPKGRDMVTPLQVAIGLVSVILGVEILAMPRDIALVSGRDGWLSLILGGLLVAVLIFFLTFLGQRFPGQSPVVYIQRLLGKPLGTVLMLLMVAIYGLQGAYMVREFADIAKLYLLPRTPTELLILSMLFVSAYAVNHGINAVLRVMQVFFPLLIIPLFLLFLMASPLTDIQEILPLLDNGAMPVLKGAVASYDLYSGFSLVAFFLPFLQKPYKARTACFLGLGVVVLLYLLIYIVSLAAFGPVELTYILYPVVDLVRMIEVPGTFIERLDVIILSLWILAAFNSVTALFYVVVFILSELLQISALSSVTYLVLPFLYVIAIFPPDIVLLGEFGDMVMFLRLLLSILAPLVIMGAIFWQRGGKGK